MTTPQLPQSGLAAAIVRAQSLARAVGKDATNTFHRYKYASAEAIIAEARIALCEAGLALLPLGWTFLREDIPGEKSPIGTITSRHRLIHGATGEHMDLETPWPVILEKGRPEDKALAGALTTSLGYLLRGLLLLPREDQDAAPDQRDDRDYEPRREVRREPERAPAPQGSDIETSLSRDFVRRAKAAPDGPAVAAIAAEVKIATMTNELRELALAAIRSVYAEKTAPPPGEKAA